MTTIGHTGCVSPFTAFNSERLSWSINSANLAMGLNIPGGMRLDRMYYFAESFLNLFKTGRFVDLLDTVKLMPGNYPVIATIGGPGQNEMASIEICPIDVERPKDPAAFVNMVRSVGSDNVRDPKDIISPEGYAQTNVLHCQGWKEHLGHEPVTDPICFSDEQEANLDHLIKKGDREQSLMKTLKSFLSKRINGTDEPAGATKLLPPLNERCAKDPATTYFMVAFNHQKGKLQVSFQQVPEMGSKEGQCTPWIKTSVLRP